MFGFSLGAVFALILSQKIKCNLVILGSMTPLRYFKNEINIKELIEATDKGFVLDIVKILKDKNLAKKIITIYGDKEEEKADFYVKNTEHKITENYIKLLKYLIK